MGFRFWLQFLKNGPNGCSSDFGSWKIREKQRWVENSGEHTIKTPAQKRVLDTPPMIRLCSRYVIFLGGNGHRPDQSHFLRIWALQNWLWRVHSIVCFPPKIVRYVSPPPPPLSFPKIGRTPKGLYSRGGGRSRHLLETQSSEPLLRTLLRTLVYCKTHSRPLLRTLLRTLHKNPFQNLLRTLLRTLCCSTTP